MNDTKVYFKLEDIDLISDQTFRKFLKELSKLMREVLFEEIDELTIYLEYPVTLKQSIKRKVENKLSELPVFYINDLKKGSIEIKTILAASFYFFLFEPIKEGYLESDLAQWLKNKSKSIFNKIYTYITNERTSKIYKKLKSKKGKLLGGRFKIVSVKKSNNEILVLIQFIKLETKKDKPTEVYTIESFLKEFEEIIKKIEDRK